MSSDYDHQMGPDGKRFPWGHIDAVHRIGDFAIVEATRTRPISNVVGGHLGEVSFHCYVFGDLPHDFASDTHCSFASLDEALALCIAYKYDKAGANTRAHTYFMRGIGAR